MREKEYSDQKSFRMKVRGILNSVCDEIGRLGSEKGEGPIIDKAVDRIDELCEEEKRNSYNEGSDDACEHR